MNQSANQVNIVVAHSLEAKPLLELFGLKLERGASSYSVYKCDAGINLIVSGMGKSAAAAATSHLAATLEAKSDSGSSPASAWLNLGIAGHQTADIGTGLLANKVTDGGSAKSFYPSMLLTGYASSQLITVDEPELNYPLNAAYEMEAFGFWSAASRRVTSELIQAYKVVSDNPSHPTEKIDSTVVYQLIADHGKAVQQLVAQLQQLVAEYNAAYCLPAEFDRINSKVRLSVTQQSQLKRLCQRFHALGIEAELEEISCKSPASARQLIAKLESRIENLNY